MEQEYKLNLVNHEECLHVDNSERRVFKVVKVAAIRVAEADNYLV